MDVQAVYCAVLIFGGYGNEPRNDRFRMHYRIALTGRKILPISPKLLSGKDYFPSRVNGRDM